MTTTQVNYWNMREQRRHNLAVESESKRSNMTKESHDRAALAVTSQHYSATEAIQDKQAQAAADNVLVRLAELKETARHYGKMEEYERLKRLIEYENAILRRGELNVSEYVATTNAELKQLELKLRGLETVSKESRSWIGTIGGLGAGVSTGSTGHYHNVPSYSGVPYTDMGSSAKPQTYHHPASRR